MKAKVLVIVGPTASGKSDLAVELALKFNGEVISADSRQVYRGLDIGTGKITEKEMRGVPHYLLDVADPKERFSVNDWKTAAQKSIEDIIGRGKLPIICGGTGYYIDALVNDLNFPEIEVDDSELKTLESKSLEGLKRMLESLDVRRFQRLEENGGIDNKRRIVRSILVAQKLGAVPEQKARNEDSFEYIFIGILPPDDVIKDRIKRRLISRIENGMIEEARKLNANGLSFERMDELGLEYRYEAQLLQGNISRDELIDILSTRIWQYARRQKTWWKRNVDIHWFQKSDDKEIDTYVRKVL